MIVGVDINPDPRGVGPQVRHDAFRQPEGTWTGIIVQHLVALTDGGADYHVRLRPATPTVMRQALEACHRGWGTSIVIGVAEAGKEISRPVRSSSSPAATGAAPRSAARKGRTDVPRIVDWYMNGKIEIDPMITHVLSLDEINKGFDLMHAGESIRSVVVY